MQRRTDVGVGVKLIEIRDKARVHIVAGKHRRAQVLTRREEDIYQDGYRIVYFFPDSTYKVGTFCGNIEGFMMDFVEMEPIIDENDIPKFISTDDLLDRYLNDVFAAESVAIYKTNGILIAKKDRIKKNIK